MLRKPRGIFIVSRNSRADRICCGVSHHCRAWSLTGIEDLELAADSTKIESVAGMAALFNGADFAFVALELSGSLLPQRNLFPGALVYREEQAEMEDPMGEIQIVLLLAALICAVCAVVSAVLLTRALDNRGLTTPLPFYGLFLLRNLERYKELTRIEAGEIGPLFYAYVIPINAAWALALAVLAVGALKG